MRVLAYLAASSIALAAAVGQVSLPAPLARDYDVLAKAPSLTVVYSVKVGDDASMPYTLVLARPGAFRLTSPTGYVLSDGTTVTTYKSASKSYTQEPYSDAWATAFSHRPEVAPWGAYLLKDPASDLTAAKAGTPRKVQGFDTDTVAVGLKKGPSAVLFLDKALGVARGALLTMDGKETLVTAKTLTLGKEPMAMDAFAFVPPEGSTKETMVATADFATVKAMIDDRCMPCHGGANPRAGINLSTYAGIVANVVPGDPANSLLIKSVKGDGVRLMPLGNHPKLTPDEIKLWSDWVAAGAKQ